jgi:predicted Fe-S protein YdhL (DUF1289 family)
MCQNVQVHPKSPCTKICTLDASGTCIGCLRTLTEIATWAAMTSKEQWQLLAVLEERRRRVPRSEPVPVDPTEVNS